MAFDELRFVDWLGKHLRHRPEVALGVGDDMAVLASQRGFLLLSCDMLLDGVHFDSTKHDLEQIGRKALCCGLSDCAAMAVRPAAATVAVAVPAAFENDDAKKLYRGILTAAEEFEVGIVGGDTTRWRHPLAIDVAVTAGAWDGIDPVTRRGAKPGDKLYVTGKLGGSLLGRHLSFVPRIQEAKAIAASLGSRLHAAMDISDGLSLDLWRMCRASGVGAILDEPKLASVISDDAVKAAGADGRAPLDHLLGDGEDFELLLAVDGRAEVDGVDLYEVGEMTEVGLQLRDAQDRCTPIEPRGFVH